MTVISHGDRLLPDQFGADRFSIHYKDGILLLEMWSDDGKRLILESPGAMSFRYTYEEVYEDYIEGSLNRLLVLQKPAWEIRYRKDQGVYGDIVRERSFYHLNIPDVGIIEFWAKSVIRKV